MLIGSMLNTIAMYGYWALEMPLAQTELCEKGKMLTRVMCVSLYERNI